MLAPMRRARIIELVRKEGVATLKQMSLAVGASVSTLRRDVDYLCEVGHLERTHGGAMLNLGRLGSFEPETEIATELEQEAKRRIGEHAALLIQPGQTVIFDSGTTTAAAARAARHRGIPFTAYTNDLTIARSLSVNPAIQTFIAGGQIRHGSATILGSDARQSISRLQADIAFVGTHALTADDLSDTSIELAEFKRALLKAAVRMILLVDSSKIFSRAFCSFGRTSDVSEIITDDRISAAALQELRARGIPVDCVEGPKA